VKTTVANFVINFFENKGLDTVFLVSGGAVMFLTDAIANSKKISCICNHNEQASAICADGYAKIKNDISLCIGTSGPGATNMITGISGAWVDSSPVFAISGQSKLCQTLQGSGDTEIRQYGLQELNIIDIVKPVTKYAIMINDPKSIGYHLDKAYYKATTGRTGPVWIDIPVDIQGMTIDTQDLLEYTEDYDTTSNELEDDNFKNIVKLLEKSTRPVLVAGNGIKLSNGKLSFLEFVKKHNILVITTPLAADLLPYSDANYIGHPGIKGDRAGNFLIQNADLILAIGTSLHVSIIGYEEYDFGKNIKKIVVDIDKHQLEKHKFDIDYKVCLDSKVFLDKLLMENIKMNVDGNWLKYGFDLKRRYPVIGELHQDEEDRVNYYQIIEYLNKAVCQHDKPTVISYDSGSAFYVAGQALKINETQRVVAPGGFGGMGYALPAAMGAYYADTKATSIAIIGDGSVQMNIQELGAISANKIPVKIIIVNNDGYVSIRNTQNRFFDQCIAESPDNGVTNPDFLKICEAYDIPYFKLDKKDLSKGSMINMLNYDGPIVCEILSNTSQELLPVNTSKKNDDGSIVSAPLEDMYPFLDRDIFEKNMRFKQGS
jgi:acetolactate synthase I/II/III large subunit